MTRSRWIWILTTLLLLAGLGRLRFDAEVLHLLPEELPVVRGLLQQQRYFANARELMITVQAEDPDAALRVAGALAGRLALQTNLIRGVRWQPPWREHPEDAAENLAWMWLQQPPTAVRGLADRLSSNRLADHLASVRERLATSLDPQDLARTSYDPLGLSRLSDAGGIDASREDGAGIFADETGTFRVLQVEPARSDLNYREAAVWLEDVRAHGTAVLRDPDFSAVAARLGYTGSPAFVAEISGGMERDLRNSVLTTVILIAALFWIAHRSWRPLGWLLLSLGLTLGLTLALGGLLFGTLNVISVGFAAVLLGLAVDYGLVGYQEAVAQPGAGPDAVRREVSRGIWYSAGTTAGTFLLLGFAGLPGLARLGQLTAIGLLVGAVVMLYFYLPRVCPVPPRRSPSAASGLPGGTPRGPVRVWGPTAAVVVLILGALGARGLPELTSSDDPLRPRSSAAYEAMDQVKARLGRTNEPLRLMFQGTNAVEVAQQMEAARRVLIPARERGAVASLELPDGFWPRPDRAAENRRTLGELVTQGPELRTAVLNGGFNSNAVALLDGVLAAWPRWIEDTGGGWPTNGTARWLTRQFGARTADGGWLAQGAVFPGPAWTDDASLAGLPDSVLVSSWSTLSQRLVTHVRHRVIGLSALIALALIGCLWLAFRRWKEVLLSGAALALSFALLLAVMSLVGWSWNLLSLVALPLLLGISVDSTIHLQLALRRHRGDRQAVWNTTGRALLLCAGANIAGFGSLAWSSNLGLASLDVVCAVGVGCVFVVCVGLLPMWWHVWAGVPAAGDAPSGGPSALYGPLLWRAGQHLARLLPDPVAAGVAAAGALLYRRLLPRRFDVVVANLRPVVGDGPKAAEQAARANFRQFTRKLLDLWRQEAGVTPAGGLHPAGGWEYFRAARASGQGVLLVTPHLGNWELGASLLVAEGVRPLVLTAPEPGGQFTELRAAARSRQGVDTLVVGDDPFAFVEVIRRLQSGGMVALLLDRPPAATAVEVEFFGRPFRASVAAAELARASGAMILPVFIVRDGSRHVAYALPPVDYDRRALGNRAARQELTGRILRAFEPAVRQFPDQWFHFVPVWQSAGPTEGSSPASGPAAPGESSSRSSA
jgi:uncharacterized protein